MPYIECLRKFIVCDIVIKDSRKSHEDRIDHHLCRICRTVRICMIGINCTIVREQSVMRLCIFIYLVHNHQECFHIHLVHIKSVVLLIVRSGCSLKEVNLLILPCLRLSNDLLKNLAACSHHLSSSVIHSLHIH